MEIRQEDAIDPRPALRPQYPTGPITKRPHSLSKRAGTTVEPGTGCAAYKTSDAEETNSNDQEAQSGQRKDKIPKSEKRATARNTAPIAPKDRKSRRHRDSHTTLCSVLSLRRAFYSVLRLRSQPTSPAPMLPSRIAPGAGITLTRTLSNAGP